MKAAPFERGRTQLLYPLAANLLLVRAMNDERQRVDWLVVQQEGHLHHITLLVPGILVAAEGSRASELHITFDA